MEQTNLKGLLLDGVIPPWWMMPFSDWIGEFSGLTKDPSGIDPRARAQRWSRSEQGVRPLCAAWPRMTTFPMQPSHSTVYSAFLCTGPILSCYNTCTCRRADLNVITITNVESTLMCNHTIFSITRDRIFILSVQSACLDHCQQTIISNYWVRPPRVSLCVVTTYTGSVYKGVVLHLLSNAGGRVQQYTKVICYMMTRIAYNQSKPNIEEKNGVITI